MSRRRSRTYCRSMTSSHRARFLPTPPAMPRIAARRRTWRKIWLTTDATNEVPPISAISRPAAYGKRPESRRVSQWIDCQNGEKARQKAGPEARPSRYTNKEHRENIEPAERRRDGYITAHHSRPAWAKRNRSIHYNATPHSTRKILCNEIRK